MRETNWPFRPIPGSSPNSNLCSLGVGLSATAAALLLMTASAGPAFAQQGPVPEAVEEIEVAAEPELAVEEAEGLTVNLNGEYRVRSVRIDPVELSGEGVRDIGWTEQRLRIDTSLERKGIGRIVLQLDALDGVLLGDNGVFLGTPSSNSGVSLSTKRPNVTTWEVGLAPGADPLDRESYVPVLREGSLLDLNFLYADINLPVGILRVGRQPLNYGANITAHDGERRNRWGVSQYSDGTDRILFATKLDQIYGVIVDGDDHVPDTSQENGIIWAVFYDFMKQDSPYSEADDLRQIGSSLQFRVREADWAGWDWRGLMLSATMVNLRNEQFNTNIFGFPLLFETEISNLAMRLQYTHLRGQTREVSEGFAALTNTEATDQDLRAHGAQAIIDYKLGPVVLTMEANYASGDDNPGATAPITAFSFARDLNVGLLLFEHIMAFESARSVAVGVENLAGLDAASFPLTEVRTDGRLTNAIVLFPQIYADLFSHPHHNVHTRFGALFAWSAAALGVMDPVMTALNDVGGDIEDHAVNFHGGRPGTYYGTEIDVQLGYRFRDNFLWTLEGAVLFPGNGIQNEHGSAVRSFLLENRFEFLF